MHDYLILSFFKMHRDTENKKWHTYTRRPCYQNIYTQTFARKRIVYVNPRCAADSCYRTGRGYSTEMSYPCVLFFGQAFPDFHDVIHMMKTKLLKLESHA